MVWSKKKEEHNATLLDAADTGSDFLDDDRQKLLAVRRRKRKDGPTISNPVFSSDSDSDDENENSKLTEISEDVFLVTKGLTMFLEVFSASFTLWVATYGMEKRVVDSTTIAYYSLLAICSAILVANSVYNIRQAKKQYRRKKIGQDEKKVAIWMEYTTIAASVAWVLLSGTALFMNLVSELYSVQMISLLLSIFAPIAGAISACIRIKDVILANRRAAAEVDEDYSRRSVMPGVSSSDNEQIRDSALRKLSMVRHMKTGLYLLIAVFEIVHCCCHMYEAYLLVGKTHRLFLIDDKAFLVTQLGIVILFVIMEIAEKIVEHRSEKQRQSALSSECDSDQYMESSYVIVGPALTRETTKQEEPQWKPTEKVPSPSVQAPTVSQTLPEEQQQAVHMVA